jgi:transcriptional regulator GlxA family with amidase domain
MSVANMLSNNTMLHIGVLLVAPIQLLDISPIDLFAMATQEYFQQCFLPQPLIDIAIPTNALTISYIAASGPNTTVPTTARLNLGVDAGLADPTVAPGKLDILVIPGPPPDTRPQEEELQFVRDHVEAGVELLTICTGVFVAGFAGVLDGKRATGTAGVEGLLKKEFPKVKWEHKRYVNDGKIWTSGKSIRPTYEDGGDPNMTVGGITNGMDMVAVYMRQRWPGTLSETVLSMADVQPRNEDYQ